MQLSPAKKQLFAPYDWYRTMRATQPVCFDKENNCWHVFSYDDVERVYGLPHHHLVYHHRNG